MRFKVPFFWVLISLSLIGCSLPKKQVKPNNVSLRMAKEVLEKPLPPEQAEEILEVAGGNYIYGQGVGRTALNVGATVLFPPYGIYLLGNALLDYKGYQTYYVTDILREKGKQGWDRVYDTVTSAPGRVLAGLAGEDFRSDDEANRRLDKVVNKHKRNGSKQFDRIDSQATGS